MPVISMVKRRYSGSGNQSSRQPTISGETGLMATTARSTSIREKLSFEIDQRHSESQCEPTVHDAPANGSG